MNNDLSAEADRADLLFLKSAMTLEGAFWTLEQVLHWVNEQNKKVTVNVNNRSIKALSGWGFDTSSGRLCHETGKFFSIDGIKVTTNWNGPKEWRQPIINQPEVGFLGIITKEFKGVLHFLLQAKIEPGNIPYVQLSPTLQATRSNYTQVHKGREPLYLDYFRKAQPAQILLDQLQSEQGARFFRKRNRNIILKLEEDIEERDQFLWLTLGQIKTLMQYDGLINMDTRTVISCISFGNHQPGIIDLIDFLAHDHKLYPSKRAILESALTVNTGKHSTAEIITFLTKLKSMYDLEVERVPLSSLPDWIIDEDAIRHRDNQYFKVIGVDVEIGNREVMKWSQPMIEPAQEGLCAFILKNINGLLHFAVQAKLECGNLDIVEFAPTVQCLTGNYRRTATGALPFLDYVLSAGPDQILFDTLQSEEGGRFYREQNRNLLVLAGDEIPEELPPRYIWMTLNQLQNFLKFNNYLNIQARSLIAALSFV